ncbi:TonB-dependent receptor [Porticoccus sp. W117]|uniref:TonB-dependent receptor n=1 Tax=Porticoccus sp. W117 TaxID=3054777 RepID=UPI002596189B|nr:TonB-dependent receptor [Porticoccus sp. W117]MDM3872157.1 TonB-dependent receptor [Porticoccus sp. W117]
MKKTKLAKAVIAASCAAATLYHGSVFAQDSKKIEFDIEAQNLATALNDYGLQSGAEVLFASSELKGKSTKGFEGVYTKEQAIELLLSEAGIEYRFIKDGTLVVGKSYAATLEEESKSTSGAESNESSKGDDKNINNINALRDKEVYKKEEESAKERRGLTEIVVTGTRNVGVRRFDDDAQPYTIFTAEDIQSSMASNLEDFFRTRLTQNTSQGSRQQFTSFGDLGTPIGNASEINLRGLGADQTLILVNGRRAPRINFGSEFQQADVNGIPLSSIERIEILPSTASGIYGGGATGGVINIITRRDYVGGEIQVEYNDTFQGNLGDQRIGGSYGFSLEDGKTNVLISASMSESNELLRGDRPFAEQSFALALENDPDAVFGSFFPFQGATTNIRSLAGDLTLLDGTPLGSTMTFVPFGYEGVGSDGGQGLIDNAGQFNTQPSQDFEGLGRPLVQSPKTESISLSVRREFTPDIEVFLDATFNSNEGQDRNFAVPTTQLIFAGSPGNPFQQTVAVSYPAIGPVFDSEATNDSLQLVGGTTINLPNDWHLTADYNWSRASTESIGTFVGFNLGQVTAAVRDGSLDVFRDTTAFPLDLSQFAYLSPNSFIGPRDTTLKNAAVRVSGPAWDLPAGAINVSALIETRDETMEGSFTDSINFTSLPPGELSTRFTPERGQSTDSVYLEALFPLISSKNSIPGVQELDFQLSARYDSYETESPSAFDSIQVDSRNDVVDPVDTVTNEFSSTDFTAGIRYVINNNILLRASYGTGFLPPSVSQIFPIETPSGFFGGFDPKRGGQFSSAFIPVRSAGNPDLVAEESDSWSAGIILTPEFLPNFRLSVDYTLIDKTNEVRGITGAQLLELEDSFPGRVVRAELTPEDIAAGFTGGQILSVDRSAINLAESSSESVDIRLDQDINTENFGDFRVYLAATYVAHLESQIAPEDETLDSVGFDRGALEWRGNGGVTWDSPLRDWSLGWNFQYYDDYFVYSSGTSDFGIDTQVRLHGTDTINSEVYHDLNAVYRFVGLEDVAGGLFDGMEVRFGIQNVFDKVPAIRPSTSPSAGDFSAFGDVRLRRYTLTFRKSF